MISGDTHARAQASGRPMGSEHRITRCARAPPGGAQVKKKIASQQEKESRLPGSDRGAVYFGRLHGLVHKSILTDSSPPEWEEMTAPAAEMLWRKLLLPTNS